MINGFTTSPVQIGLNLGYTTGISFINSKVQNSYALTGGFYIGPSSVTLTKDQFRDESKYISNTNAPTLTYGFNLIASRNTLGLVLAYGWEVAYGKFGHQWLYNYKPYWGIGINSAFGR